jgi:hypothetical protein
MNALIRAFLASFQRQEPAGQRGKRLLRANLTPAQLEQFETFRYFEVIGGDTGRRYRIHRSDALNVDEYDEAGTRISRWCFLPVGNLVRGDVLLAQKLALELFESDARAIANKYPNNSPCYRR